MADSKDKDLDENSADLSPSGEEGLSAEELAAIERWQAMASGEDDESAAEDMVLSQPEAVEKKPRAKGKKSKAKRIEGATAVDEPLETPPLALTHDPDNGLGDEFTEEAEPELGSAPVLEDERAEDPGDSAPEELKLIPSPPQDLSLQAESEDRQGLMRWDEAINLEAQIEAIIFAAPKPISVSEISELLADDDGIEPDHGVVDNHIQQLQRLYKERNGGFRLEYDKGAGFQFRTVPAAAPLMERMFSSRQRPLSRAAHETLAIIAYRQPCTRADIEFIRGVDAGSIIKNLLERDLVTCVGRKEDSGRPMLFGTTSEFLRVFRIQSLNDLPPLSAFQPASEAMIAAFQKIESPEDTIDVEGFIGDEERDPIDVTQHQLAEFAASEAGIDVREDALETASQPAQIRRAGASYDDEGYSRDDGLENTEVAIEPGPSITPGSGEDASRGPDSDQRQSGEGTRDED